MAVFEEVPITFYNISILNFFNYVYCLCIKLCIDMVFISQQLIEFWHNIIIICTLEFMHSHTLNWVGAEGGVYFFWASGGGLRVGTGFDTEGGYRGGTVSKKKISKWP